MSTASTTPYVAPQEHSGDQMAKIRYFYNRYHNDTEFRERMKTYARNKHIRKTMTCTGCKIIRAKIPEDGSPALCVMCQNK